MGKRVFQTLFLVLLFVSFFNLAYAEEICTEEICTEEICTEETCHITGKTTETYYESVYNQLSKEEDTICIIYFHKDKCNVCDDTKPFIEELENKYAGKIKIHKYEISNNLNNYQLYNTFCAIQNIPIYERGLPLVAINEIFFMGIHQIKGNLENEITRMLEAGERVCPLPQHMSCQDLHYNQSSVSPVLPGITGEITIPLIVFSGLIDGINPCAFAVLIFFLTYLFQISNNKKKMLKAGAAYIGSVYISYLLAGFGLFSIIQVSGFSRTIYLIAAIIAIIAGAINIKDYFWYGKGITLKIPESRKKTIQNLTYKANIPAAILLGFLVSMFELPCTGGVYLAILALLAGAGTKSTAIPYLSVYNLMFVLPLIIILFLVIKGMKVENIEKWRKSKRNLMKLGLGLLMVGLGIWMLVI